MSLINKMLVDLDARRVASNVATGAAPAAENICHDLIPVVDAGSPVKCARQFALPVTVLVIGLIGAALWGEWRARSPSQAADSEPRGDYTSALTSTWPIAAPTVPVENALPAEETTMAFEEQPPFMARVDDVPPETVSLVVREEDVPRVVPPPSVERDTREVTYSPPPVLVEKTVRPLTAEQKVDRAYRLALEQFTSGQFDLAERNLRDALSLDKAHVQARELLVGLLLQAGRSAAAAQILIDGLAQTPSHYPFASLLSGIYVEQGREPAALETLLSARAHAQTDAEYLGFLATLLQRAGRHAEAIESYRAALSYKSLENKWWLGLGISYLADDDTAGAEHAFNEALKKGDLPPALSHYASEQLREIRGRENR